MPLEASFSILSFGFLSNYVRDGTNRFMGDLDAETSKIVCDSFGKTFGVGEDDKTTMFGVIRCHSFLVVYSVGGHCE